MTATFTLVIIKDSNDCAGKSTFLDCVQKEIH